MSYLMNSVLRQHCGNKSSTISTTNQCNGLLPKIIWMMYQSLCWQSR